MIKIYMNNDFKVVKTLFPEFIAQYSTIQVKLLVPESTFNLNDAFTISFVRPDGYKTNEKSLTYAGVETYDDIIYRTFIVELNSYYTNIIPGSNPTGTAYFSFRGTRTETVNGESVVTKVSTSGITKITIHRSFEPETEFVESSELSNLQARVTAAEANALAALNEEEASERFLGRTAEDNNTMEVDLNMGSKNILLGGKPLAVQNGLIKFDSNDIFHEGNKPTKEDIGLENVENLGLATKIEAETGTLNTKYMTPLRTKEAIAAQVSTATFATKAEVAALDLGEDNIIETVKVNGTALTVDSNKAVNVDISGKADLVNGIVPASQLPAFVDQVQSYPSITNFPLPGLDNVIYKDTNTNLIYR
jgi:hypothetical protein